MTTPLQAAERLLAIKRAQSNFGDYISVRHPEWIRPDFHQQLIDALDDLIHDRLIGTTGLIVDNLIVTMPPRHSKSTFCTVELPAFAMGEYPELYVMTASYNAELATEFGREVRNIVNEDKAYRQVFPQVELAKDSQSAATWRTNKGGAFYGMGLGGSTSGRPANLQIIDDPYKNRPDAESPTVRRKVWEYYQSALDTRLQPRNDGRAPKRIVIHTRWHPDDLIGRIMDSRDFADGEWAHVDFKALVDEGEPTERALWPERFPLKRLHRIKASNPRDFAALYQQNPTVEGGNIIKSHWWQYYPEDLKPESFATLIIAADTAFKKGQGNDYTAMIPMGLTHQGDIFFLDLIKERMEFHEAKKRFIQQNALYRGKGLRAIYIEDKASGQSIIQELKRQSGMSVIPWKAPDGASDKVARAHAISPLIQGGRVYLPENAPWIEDFLKEAEEFPDGSFDDSIDAAMIGMDVLSRTSISPDELFEQGTSLLEEYNQTRDIITGNNHPATKGSLNALAKSGIKWNGWGL